MGLGSEPEIVINGKTLTIAEAMTVRVAIGMMQITLSEGLGDDATGKSICEGYKRACQSINEIMIRGMLNAR